MTSRWLMLITAFCGALSLSGCEDRSASTARRSQAEDSVSAPIDLPSGLLGMSDEQAHTAIYLDEHIFTRIDSTASGLACDEGMPERMLFVADGRVLKTTPSNADFTAQLELVSAATGEAKWNGCDLENLVVDQHPRTDTVEVSFRRYNQTWELANDYVYARSTHTHYVIAGPVDSVSGVDWRAVGVRVDSIRKALGHPLARPRVVPSGNVVQQATGKLEFPAYVLAGCPAAAAAPVAEGMVELSYTDNLGMAGSSSQAGGDWFALYTSDSTRGATCIAPVKMVLASTTGTRCDSEGNQKQNQEVFTAEGLAQHPLLLVRNVAGVRIGLGGSRLSVETLNGWNAGLLIYSDSGHVMTILQKGEARPDRMVYYLTAEWKGKSYPLFGGDAYPGDTWGVYWVGLLNGDDLPDFIIRVNSTSSKASASKLELILSDSHTVSWKPAAISVVRFC